MKSIHCRIREHWHRDGTRSLGHWSAILARSGDESVCQTRCLPGLEF